jgi:hypothetical protein
MMKKVLSVMAIAGVVVMFSCEMNEAVRKDQVSVETLSKISALGFSTENVIRTNDGYLVEGDIILHEHNLSGPDSQTKLRIAEVEQYRTFNLVGGTPRVIKVGTSGNVPNSVSTAINSMITRYNNENLNITFQRVTSGADITISIVNGGSYIASAGFPSNGNPYHTVSFNKRYANYSQGFLTTVLAHEVGHCIGFRHTDYMNRSYSCGTGGNEGQETTGVGAVHIPGTPSGPDAGSWMLACAGASTDRPFNANDKTALNYLY